MGILFAVVGIIWIEVPPLLHRAMTRELLLFSMILVFGLVTAVLTALRIHPPNPYHWVELLYQPITDWLNSIFQ